MITIQGKEFRNFAEQINKNKDDIAKLPSTPSTPAASDIKPYLLLINFQYVDYGLITQTGYGYTIVYMTMAEADKREAEQTVPNYIQFTASISTTSGEMVITDILEYQPSDNTLLSPITGGMPNLTINTIHYQEFTI